MYNASEPRDRAEFGAPILLGIPVGRAATIGECDCWVVVDEEGVVRSTLCDPELQARLERDGFVTFPMLDAEEVLGLREGFARLGDAPGDPHKACHSSFHSYDTDYKRAVNELVGAALAPHLTEAFDRQRSLPCNFIVKWPSAMSGFGLHQDLTLVDESQHRSVEVWVALDDTNELNGQLWMVPGSHRWLPGNIRGINGFDFAFKDVTRRIIDHHAVPVPVPAGHAVVFTHAILHFSLPNRTDTPRMVAITDLIPEEAEHLHFFGDGAGNIDIYRIDDAFWTDNNPFTLWRPPSASQRIGRSDAVARTFTDADLDECVRSGLAIESTVSPKGAPNAAKAWCHRCGRSDLDVYPPDRWTGNVTLLCDDCREAEVAHAASRDHVGALLSD